MPADPHVANTSRSSRIPVVLAATDAQITGLSPSYFALVMATGIVSIGAHLLGVAGVDVALFVINIAAYLALWVLTALRLVRHRDALLRDLIDHQRGVGFFTAVAGTSVLAADLNELGAWLELHVRHEERVLFPLIEDATGMAVA